MVPQSSGQPGRASAAALPAAPGAQYVVGDLELPGSQDRPLAQPAVYVCPRRPGPLRRPRPGRRKVWWRNLRQPTRVRLRLQGRDLEGTATASSDPEAVAAGLRHYLARYPKAARPLGVRVDANGTPHGTTTAAHPLVVVSVHLDR